MECAHCKKPATLACSGCKGAPVLEGDAAIAHYCNSACQKADWDNHKATCNRLKDRTPLYRAATTAQKLYYICRELTWVQFDVERVEKTGQNLVLHEQVFEEATWPKDYRVFPSHLLRANEDREAVLSFLSCRDAVLWMIEFVDGMLEGIVLETFRISYKTKNDKRRTRICPEVMREISHQILKLRLRSGETFAFDITGAQYGYHDPIMRWQEYEHLRILRVYYEDEPPRPKSTLQIQDYSLPKMHFFVQKMNEPKSKDRAISGDILEAMNLHILEWQCDESLR